MADYQFEGVRFRAWGPHEGNDGGFTLIWSCKDMGFGELSFVRMKDGTVRCDNECMGIEFVKAVFDYFIATVSMDWVWDGEWNYQRKSKPAPEEVREEIVKRIREGNVDVRD